MTTINVRIGPNGEIETLLKESVLNVRQFGDAKIERITLIEFDEAVQGFYIKWLLGPNAGEDHTYEIDRDILGSDSPFYDTSDAAPALPVIYFETYELAVAHEIKCVNALRLAGVSFSQ